MGIYRRGNVWWISYYDQNRAREFRSLRTVPTDITHRTCYPCGNRKFFAGYVKRPVKISFGDFSQKYMEFAKANKRSWLRDEQMLKHLQAFSEHKWTYLESLPSISRVTNSSDEQRFQEPP